MMFTRKEASFLNNRGRVCLFFFVGDNMTSSTGSGRGTKRSNVWLELYDIGLTRLQWDSQRRTRDPDAPPLKRSRFNAELDEDEKHEVDQDIANVFASEDSTRANVGKVLCIEHSCILEAVELVSRLRKIGSADYLIPLQQIAYTVECMGQMARADKLHVAETGRGIMRIFETGVAHTNTSLHLQMLPATSRAIAVELSKNRRGVDSEVQSAELARLLWNDKMLYPLAMKVFSTRSGQANGLFAEEFKVMEQRRESDACALRYMFWWYALIEICTHRSSVLPTIRSVTDGKVLYDASKIKNTLMLRVVTTYEVTDVFLKTFKKTFGFTDHVDLCFTVTREGDVFHLHSSRITEECSWSFDFYFHPDVPRDDMHVTSNYFSPDAKGKTSQRTTTYLQLQKSDVIYRYLRMQSGAARIRFLGGLTRNGSGMPLQEPTWLSHILDEAFPADRATLLHTLEELSYLCFEKHEKSLDDSVGYTFVDRAFQCAVKNRFYHQEFLRKFEPYDASNHFSNNRYSW